MRSLPSSWLRALLALLTGRRLKSALLAAVVLSGGGGLPLIDLTFYHGLSRSHSSEQHFESSDVPHWGDHCTLGAQLPYSTEAGPAAVHISSSPSPVAPKAVFSVAPRSVNLDLLPSPRAPPGLLA